MCKLMLCLAAVIAAVFLAIPGHATETVLYNFCQQQGCPDGADPVADLVLDGAGNIWGTAKNGGQFGLGTVFELTASSGFTKLGQVYSFHGGAKDGANPKAGLVFDPATGDLYGTTASGGSTNCSGGCGAVFALHPGSNTNQVLHFFSGFPNDGANPSAQLLLDASGNLYGTTASGGGPSNCPTGCGIVFRLNIGSNNYQILHGFTGSDGKEPVAGVVFDGTGNLWGTALDGGANGFGTIFELKAPNFTLGQVYSFKGVQFGDGANPAAALVFDATGIDGGYLYGTTSAGGLTNCAGGCGTVFEQHPTSDVYKRLYSFTGKNGAAPVARLVIETDNSNHNFGSLYGTASLGGTTAGTCATAGCGTAFEICPPAQTCTWKEATLFRFNGLKGKNPSAGMVLFPPPPGNHEGIPLQTGRGTCTSNCVGTSGAGGSNGSGTVYKISGP